MATTVWIHDATHKRLRGHKRHPRETLGDVIERALDALESGRGAKARLEIGHR